MGAKPGILWNKGGMRMVTAGNWRALCVLAGFFAGFLLPGALTGLAAAHHDKRRITLAMLTGESLAVLLPSLFCGVLLPLQALTAMLYAGLGAAAGACVPWHGVPLPARGIAAVCVWLCLCLPFVGALACIAGLALGGWLEWPMLGLVLIPVFAAPMAFLQFGRESALIVACGTVLTVGTRLPALLRRRRAS